MKLIPNIVKCGFNNVRKSNILVGFKLYLRINQEMNKTGTILRNCFKYILGLILIFTCVVACKRVKLIDADRKFAEGEYFEAGNMYRKIYRQTKKKDKIMRGEVAFRMGEAFRLSNTPLRAMTGYANAVRYNVDNEVVNLQYARILHKTGKYTEAAKQYKLFLDLFPKNRFAINGLKGAQLATAWKKNPTRYTITKPDILNSNKGEFGPMLLPPTYDQVYFASNRKDTMSDTISGITGAKLNDIFRSRKDEQGKWMKPEHLESGVNTAGDEGGISFLADGSAMYFSSSPPDSLGTGRVGIFVSRRSGGEWASPEAVEINKRDSVGLYAHPAASSTGEFIYYVTNQGKGFGGKDIWRARMVGDLVEYTENLGSDINTAGDEMFPYLRNDSTLYFASDGHPGMGGLDIFRAQYKSAEKRWKVENLQYPINSEGDDFGITFAGDEENGFFSSNRGDARGYDHIFAFEMPTISTRIEGLLADTDDELLDSVTVRMVGKDGTNLKIQGKVNGTYSNEANRGVDYVFLASRKNHLNAKMKLHTEDMKRDSVYIVDFILTPIFKAVVLENVFYEFDKSTLSGDSKKELDGLIELLNLNPNVTIELSAHTDRMGTDEYNQKLSQARAESVVNYLIKGGIKADRLEAVGKGKTDPKKVTKGVVKKYNFLKEGDILTADFINELTEDQQEMADQINRRTEFRVTSITYNLE